MYLRHAMPDPRQHIGPITFFEISCYVSFLALSLNGEESLGKLNNSRVQIRIFTKIESIRHCRTEDVLHTARQTNRQTGVKT